ncbi:riboflavin biosynthesis protein RibF [Bacteroides coprosuis DSM 18011]|uniref:Riboflavin biosynthesis protein n=1 Tax=Bacteroides coprosuis DSM 18011 TaxID=679937 RepID=F3ZRH4_9BACE|nr:bifunctional riboflavin kinase/FAD synthetase [Bacteroides coprosuis]EGJ70699.1 riboflavin biosynthesis protein RibF [Bacteroides coprosuis DSM 18011]
MQIIDKKSNTIPSPCVASIGFFDGVHKGHYYLIKQVLAEANRRDLKSALLTFPIHPAKVMRPDTVMEHLTIRDEKLELLAKTSVDYCFLIDFTKELSQLTAREFMQFILKDKYNVKVLVIGYDHRFGHNREEGFEDYCRYGKELGIEVIQAKAFYDDSVDVSSSYIRKAIDAGDVLLAEQYLGYPYFLEGKVIQGKQLGRTIGFPTANVNVSSPDKLIPKDGVYAVKVLVEDNQEEYWGMLNIGHRPTVDDGPNRSIEVNILDFNKDIYNKSIRLLFKHRLRDEVKFSSIDKLVEQLHRDEESVRKLIK